MNTRTNNSHIGKMLNSQVAAWPGEHIPLPPTKQVSKIEDALNVCDAQLNELFAAVEAIEDRLIPVRSIQPAPPCAECKPKDKPTNVSERICDVGVSIGGLRARIRSLIAELDI